MSTYNALVLDFATTPRIQEHSATLDTEEQEHEFFYELERERRQSAPHLSETELLEEFPDARTELPGKLREWQAERRRLMAVAKQALRRRTPENAIETWFCIRLLILPRINEAEKQIARLRRLIARDNTTSGAVRGRITEADIERAKEVPIASLISTKVRRTGKTSIANCPLHNDRSPSFTIYHETNSCWCFGCQQGGDSIAFIRLLNKMSFVEAVKYLGRV